MTAEEVVSRMALKQSKLELPDTEIQPEVKDLFKDCLQFEKSKRPDFTVICERLGSD